VSTSYGSYNYLLVCANSHKYSIGVNLCGYIRLIFCWGVSSSGIWRRVVHWVWTDVSEVHIASIFRVEKIGSTKPASKHVASLWPTFLLVLLNLFIRPWRWRRYVLPKRRLKLNKLHGVISQKMTLFITTAVKTSNLTNFLLMGSCASLKLYKEMDHQWYNY
jgi:hypothetical protein